LRKRWARVCCLGCGRSTLVLAGREREALVEMKLHATNHERELSEELRSLGTLL